MGAQIFRTLVVFLLARLAVGYEDCTYPIHGLPTLTEIYYQPSHLSPQPMAKVSLKINKPILHYYWTVSDGSYDWKYYPEPRVYPVFNMYNGVLTHTQEPNPGVSQYMLYSNHYLKSVRFFFVIDIGCNILLYEIRLIDPAKSFTKEIQPVEILKSPSREMIQTQDTEWVNWQSEFKKAPETQGVYYYASDDVRIFARRNGSVLQPYADFPNTPYYRQMPYIRKRGAQQSWFDVSDMSIKLAPGIKEFASSLQIKYDGDYSFLGYMFHYMPFSVRNEELTKPAIAVDNCEPYTRKEDRLTNYTLLDNEDDGVSQIVLKRRDDTPNCFRVHVNGNPFPEYEIKDLETGEIIPNWPYKITNTYTRQLVATPPVAVGTTRTYQVTARNSQGSLTRKIKLVGYQETVLSIYPIEAHIRDKDSVVLKCAAKGQFEVLRLTNSTTMERYDNIFHTMKEVGADPNGRAELSYRFTNMTGLRDDDAWFVDVHCGLDNPSLDADNRMNFRRIKFKMSSYSTGPDYRYN